jgi:hypothetical protein
VHYDFGEILEICQYDLKSMGIDLDDFNEELTPFIIKRVTKSLLELRLHSSTALDRVKIPKTGSNRTKTHFA